MPAYKDEQRGTWYCLFYYEDWQGTKKKKQKRGFKTKKEALEWENNYKMSANAHMDMTLGSFVEIYFRDKAGELKERSVKNKRYMIKTHKRAYKVFFTSRKTLLNEFNHFEGNMNIFQPAIDITATKLQKEIDAIESKLIEIENRYGEGN